MSPTVFVSSGHHFFFFSREPSGFGVERPHLHVLKGGAEAKVWLDTLDLVYSHGFNPREQRTIRRLVTLYQEPLQSAWDEYFKDPPSHVR